MTYEGQPTYVVAGYLRDLFAHWVDACEGDEWGEYMAAMHAFADAAMKCNEEQTLVVLGWFREELQRAFDEDWWGVRGDNYGEWESVYRAQDEFDRVTIYWKERAKSFKGESALEATIARLPDWVRPMTDRLPEPDRERDEYERLRAKFEGNAT